MRVNWIRYQKISNSGDWGNAASFRAQFSTTSSVKSALTYVSDLKFGLQTDIPALQIFHLDEFTGNQENDIETSLRLCRSLKWDFNPMGFQALIQLDVSEEWRTKHESFVEYYGVLDITFVDFQHSLYCLAGVRQAGLVSFIQSRNPFKTTKGWKIADFVARFKKWEDFRNQAQGLLRFVDPVRWLEAELDREEAQTGTPRLENEDGYSDVVSWEGLMQLQWTPRPGYTLREYPRLFPSNPKQPVQVCGVNCLRTSTFAKSKQVRFERDTRGKFSNRAKVIQKAAIIGSADFIDLSHEDTLFVDQSSIATSSNPHIRPNYGSNDPFADDYDVHFHNPSNQSALQKRVRCPSVESQSQTRYLYGGELSEPSTPLTKQRPITPQNGRPSRIARKLIQRPLASVEEDIYGISDEERARPRKRPRPSYKSYNVRSLSPLPVFKIPPGWKIFGDGIHGPAATRPPKTPRSHARRGSSKEERPYPTPSTTQDNMSRNRLDYRIEDPVIQDLAQRFRDLVNVHAPRYFEEKSVAAKFGDTSDEAEEDSLTTSLHHKRISDAILDKISCSQQFNPTTFLSPTPSPRR